MWEKIENRIPFKIIVGYYLELLTPKTMKWLRSTKSKVNKDENAENVPHLEIAELELIDSDISSKDYQQDSRALYTFNN